MSTREGRWGLITGASSGIGRELARVMAADGWSLLITGRREERLQELAGELHDRHGVDVKWTVLDLGRPEAGAELEAVSERLGLEITALVNNAGFGTYGPVAETDLDEELQEIDVNVRALTELCKRFLPGMIKRGRGRIMNVASTAAFQPGPGMAVYCATKAYVLHFSEALSHELKGSGVTVTALCPGGTTSEFHARADMEHSRFVQPDRWPTSAEVAAYGYRAMMRGRTVAVHGTSNRFMAFLVRLVPRRLVTAIAARVLG